MAKQAPHRYFKEGFVYFIVCEALASVKIGRTNRWLPPAAGSSDPIFARDRRISELQTGCPAEIRIAGMLAVVPPISEANFHYHFQMYRHHGEWFWYLGKLKRFVDHLEDYGNLVVEAARASERGEPAQSPVLNLPKLDEICAPDSPLPNGWRINL